MDNSDILIDIKNFTLKYEQKILFSNFSLSLKNAESVGIFGPTGAGKTSLLNKIINDYADKIKISCAFQDNCLIEEHSVFKNILLPLQNQMSETDAKEKVNTWCQKLDLLQLQNTLCKKLSGGEKQRTNLARAFAYDGELFLFDEPFSSQDENHKNLIKKQILQLRNQKTLLIVSHNKNDLEQLCDRIVFFPFH